MLQFLATIPRFLMSNPLVAVVLGVGLVTAGVVLLAPDTIETCAKDLETCVGFDLKVSMAILNGNNGGAPIGTTLAMAGPPTASFGLPLYFDYSPGVTCDSGSRTVTIDGVDTSPSYKFTDNLPRVTGKVTPPSTGMVNLYQKNGSTWDHRKAVSQDAAGAFAIDWTFKEGDSYVVWAFWGACSKISTAWYVHGPTHVASPSTPSPDGPPVDSVSPPAPGKVDISVSITGNVEAKNLSSDITIDVVFGIAPPNALERTSVKQVTLTKNGGPLALGMVWREFDLAQVLGETAAYVEVRAKAVDGAGHEVSQKANVNLRHVVNADGSIRITVQPASFAQLAFADGEVRTVDYYRTFRRE